MGLGELTNQLGCELLIRHVSPGDIEKDLEYFHGFFTPAFLRRPIWYRTPRKYNPKCIILQGLDTSAHDFLVGKRAGLKKKNKRKIERKKTSNLPHFGNRSSVQSFHRGLSVVCTRWLAARMNMGPYVSLHRKDHPHPCSQNSMDAIPTSSRGVPPMIDVLTARLSPPRKRLAHATHPPHLPGSP